MQVPKVKTPDYEYVANNHRILGLKDHACTIDNLPVELLSSIFELAGENTDDEKDNQSVLKYWDGFRFYPIEVMALVHGSRLPSFRIVISLVCHHWCHVAILTPHLWTSLRLASWDSFEQLQTILARSKGLLLDVHISHYIEADPLVYDPALRVDPLPRLEQRYITLFGALAPRLRSMHLSDSRLNWSRSWISSLGNLTALELEDHNECFFPSWKQFIAILRAAPGLKRLALHFAGPEEGPSDSDNESTASNNTAALVPLLDLTELVLADESPEFAEGLLQKVYMPALRNLSLYISGEDYSTFIELLAGPATVPITPAAPDEQYSLLNRLESFRITSLAWPGDDGIAGLEMLYDGLYNLTLLQITVSESTAIPEQLEFLLLLRAYTPPGQVNPAVRLPLLDTLIVRSHARGVALIHEVVMSRNNAGFPLKSLYIQRTDHDEVEELRRDVETLSFF